MSYKTLIQKQVRNAFNSIGDLAKDVVLVQRANNTFDFASMEADKAAAVTKTVKAFLKLKSRDKTPEANTITGMLILNSEDLSDASIYSTAVIDGATWNLVQPYENNGFTTSIKVTREYNG